MIETSLSVLQFEQKNFMCIFIKFQDMYSLECGHKFCRRCWVQYLTQKIVEEGLSQSIKCLEPSCEMLVDDENVVMLINDDSEVMSKYHRSMTVEFVVVRKYTNFVIKLKLKYVFSFSFCFCSTTKQSNGAHRLTVRMRLEKLPAQPTTCHGHVNVAMIFVLIAWNIGMSQSHAVV